MPVVQDAFYVPEDIMIKLLNGDCRRIGGVVRRANGPGNGQLVKFLEPVDTKVAEQAEDIGIRILNFAKKNKYGLIIGAVVGVGIAVVGGLIYNNVKKREPAVMKQFRRSLFTYIDKIRSGNLDLETIETLTEALDQLKKHKNCEQFKIELSTEDLDVLVGKIYDYTIWLAENNQVELTEQERSKTDNSIINLQNYLRTQKRIFKEAV